MNAKEYLNQARHIDLRINTKLETITRLGEIANRATSTLTDMPGSPTRDIKKREKIIAKIIDLEHEVDDDIDKLVDLKKEIIQVIKNVDDEDCQVILEKRYICLDDWQEIANDMDINLRTVYRIHGRALSKLEFEKK